VSPLIAAIITKWQASTALAGSGPWFEVAEDASAYPFGIISIIGTGGHQPFYEGTYDEIVNIRMTVFDDNLADVLVIQDALHAKFDKTKLTLSSGRNYHSLRTGQMARYAGVDKNGVKVYQAISDYQFKVRKSY
jgi:hypothetical protein